VIADLKEIAYRGDGSTEVKPGYPHELITESGRVTEAH
jgi:hypothetical protein